MDSSFFGTAGRDLQESNANEVIELRVPLSDLGLSNSLDLTIGWVFEGALSETTYAASPENTLVDGYDPDYSVHFHFDLNSAQSPADQALFPGGPSVDTSIQLPTDSASQDIDTALVDTDTALRDTDTASQSQDTDTAIRDTDTAIRDTDTAIHDSDTARIDTDTATLDTDTGGLHTDTDFSMIDTADSGGIGHSRYGGYQPWSHWRFHTNVALEPHTHR